MGLSEMNESHGEVGYVIEVVVLGCGVSGIRKKTNTKNVELVFSVVFSHSYILGF